VNNLAGGSIIGTGNQRNGTVYADATAQDFVLNNEGTIDAGAGNEGAGFSAELSAGTDPRWRYARWNNIWLVHG